MSEEPKPRYFVVAKDPENYETGEFQDLIEGFKKMMWIDSEYVDEEEVELFRKYAADRENWYINYDDKPAILEWKLSDEGGGTIKFYLIWNTPAESLELTRLRAENERLAAENAELRKDKDIVDFLTQFFTIEDVGDETAVPGITVAYERMQDALTWGPSVNGVAPLLTTWESDLRTAAITAAMKQQP